MKTFIQVILSVSLVTFMAQPAQSQKLLKKLQEKVQERVETKVEERVEKKTDEAIDNQLDKIEQSLENNQDESAGNNTDKAEADALRQERMQNILKGIGMSGEPVPIADSYNFNQLIQMHIESHDKNGKKESEGEFITHLNPQSKSMAYQMISGDMGQPGQGLFIIDAENGATIILSEEKGEKTGMVYGMSSFFSTLGDTYEEETMEETPESFLHNPNVTKTGRTKTIAGYKCEEYKFSDEETESEFWITTDLKMNTQDYFSTLFKTSMYTHGIPWGYMMESTTTDKNTGDKAFMQVTRVDSNTDIHFTMTDYKITNLGSFTVPAKE